MPVTLKRKAIDQPEPGISILRPSVDFYSERHPVAKEIILLIETSDSTLQRDREIKLPIYAKAGVSEFWIVNLLDQQIEVYSNPKEGSYKNAEIYSTGDSIPFPETTEKMAVEKLFL